MFQQIVQTLLIAVIILTLYGSVYYSFKHRRETNHKLRGLLTSKMNMCMGVMMISMSFIQMFMFSGSTIRLIIGAVFLILGLFNLFAGIRNHSFFSRMKDTTNP